MGELAVLGTVSGCLAMVTLYYLRAASRADRRTDANASARVAAAEADRDAVRAEMATMRAAIAHDLARCKDEVRAEMGVERAKCEGQIEALRERLGHLTAVLINVLGGQASTTARASAVRALDDMARHPIEPGD